MASACIRPPRGHVVPATGILLLAALFVLAACGSEGAAGPGASSLFGLGTPALAAAPSPEESEGPTEESTAEVEETEEPTVEPTGEATPPPTTPGTAAGSGSPGAVGACGLDGAGQAGARLGNLDSYRAAIRVAGMTGIADASETEGEISVDMVAVRAPEPARKGTISGMGGGETASAEMNYVVIGDRVWMDLGGGALEMEGDSAQGLLGTIDSLSPETLYNTSISDWAGGLERVGEETRNGVAAVHCRANRETAAALGLAMGGASTAEWSIDVWVALDGGYLVGAIQKGEVGTGSAARAYFVQVDVTDINSPANTVDAPG